MITKSQLDEMLKNKHVTVDESLPKRSLRPHLRTIQDDQLIESYSRTGSVWKTGIEVGMSGQHVHRRLSDLNKINQTDWTEAQKFKVIEFYSKSFKSGELKEFCEKNGMLKTSVSRWARDNGLVTTYSREHTESRKLDNSSRMKEQWKNIPHPKGMLGKKHTPEAIENFRKMSTEMMDNMSAKKKRERIDKIIKTRIERGNLINPRPKASWKQGYRIIGNRKVYLRSQWEANYASYLELLVNAGQIRSWEYECETFWFKGIKRGTNNYTPDFKITTKDGFIEFHEVKGWMDDRSKTKIRRMKKYHPTITLKIIDKDWFKEHKALSKTVPGWGTPAIPKELTFEA